MYSSRFDYIDKLVFLIVEYIASTFLLVETQFFMLLDLFAADASHGKFKQDFVKAFSVVALSSNFNVGSCGYVLIVGNEKAESWRLARGTSLSENPIDRPTQNCYKRRGQEHFVGNCECVSA